MEQALVYNACLLVVKLALPFLCFIILGGIVSSLLGSVTRISDVSISVSLRFFGFLLGLLLFSSYAFGQVSYFAQNMWMFR